MPTLMRAAFALLGVLLIWASEAKTDEQPTFYGKPMAVWIAVLRNKSSTAEERHQAVCALGCFGPAATAAVPDLIELLQQEEFQCQTAGALVQIGSRDVVVVGALIEQFLEQSRQHLGGQGSIGSNACASNDLVRIGRPAVPPLIHILNGPSYDMRVCAAKALGRIGPEAVAAVPSLIRAIEHPDPDQQSLTLCYEALRALGRIGPKARTAVPCVNGLFGNAVIDDFDIVTALDGMGAPPIRKLLDAFIHDADSNAARLLAALGPRAASAAPALRAALTDPSPQVRISAAAALARIEPSTPESIPVLIEGLKYLGDGEIDASDVPAALASLGPRATAALPALVDVVNNGCDDTRLLRALVQIDPEGKQCVPALITALQSADFEIVDVAARCLGLLGPHAKEAVPALVEILTRDFDQADYNNRMPQRNAAKALGRIGAGAVPAIPQLVVVLKYRRMTGSRLGGAGTDREERDYSAAAGVAEILGSFGARAKAAVPYLIEAVKTREQDDENSDVRRAAILALGRIGPDAKAAIPVLHGVMKELGKRLDSAPEVLIALYQLEPAGEELGECWLRSQAVPSQEWLVGRLKARTMLLGSMGRTSLESDWATRRLLERVDTVMDSVDPTDTDDLESLEYWLETIGSFGTAGRVAIPRLNDLKKHVNPWVRMWAAEALEKIEAPARPAQQADSRR